MADQTPTNPKTESQEPTITSNDNSSIIDITPPSEIKTKEELTPPLQAYFKLWKYSYPLDALLRVLGAIAAFGAGTAAPLMTILFGNLVNKPTINSVSIEMSISILITHPNKLFVIVNERKRIIYIKICFKKNVSLLF